MKLRIDFSFLLFNALIFLLRDEELILSFYAVCLIHEGGHLVAICLTGERLRSLELSGFGIKMITSENDTIFSPGRILVLLAGALANFIAYPLLLCVGGLLPALDLWAGIYNLLPYSSLDGGAVLELLISGTPHEGFFRLILFTVRIVISAVLLVLTFADLRCLPAFIMSLILLYRSF